LVDENELTNIRNSHCLVLTIPTDIGTSFFFGT
jgi:hypothetical protein